MAYSIRNAELDDAHEIEALIRISAHELSQGDYTREQVESALVSVFGVDTQLIKDRTYFVVESGAEIVGCGGWSYRATLFGNDSQADRDPRRLDPNTEPAKIRAFFVHPDHARRGIGRLLLEHCEAEAIRAGFLRFELGATLPGERLYAAHGYFAMDRSEHVMESGETMTVVTMEKSAQASMQAG